MLTLEFFAAEINALAFHKGHFTTYTHDRVRSLWQQGYGAATAFRILISIETDPKSKDWTIKV